MEATNQNFRFRYLASPALMWPGCSTVSVGKKSEKCKKINKNKNNAWAWTRPLDVQITLIEKLQK